MCGLYTEFDHKTLVIFFNGPKDERYTNSNFRKKNPQVYLKLEKKPPPTVSYSLMLFL